MKHFLLYLILILFSCTVNQDKDLILQIESKISNDLVSISNSSIDQLTIGLGSILASALISKKEQGELLSRPIMPYIKDELNKKNTEELSALAYGTTSIRLKLLGECLLSNRKNITAKLKEEGELIAPISEDIINHIILTINKLEKE